MDLSKLPKLSQTDAPPPAEPPPVQPLPVAPMPMGVGPDVWFNTAVGLLLVFLGKTFFSWLIARIAGHPFHTGVDWTDGRGEVPYFQLEGFTAYTDMGLFIFGAVVLLEAFVKAVFGIMGRAPKSLAGFAVTLAVLGTALNLFVCAKLMGAGLVPMLSGLAVAYGGYIVFDLMTIYRTPAARA